MPHPTGRRRSSPTSFVVPASPRARRRGRARRVVGRAVSTSRSERGAAAVEMAMISVILMMILLGIVTFGLTNYQNISIEGAAREASRFGATYPVADAGSLEQWLRDVAQVAENAATGALNGTDSSRIICVSYGFGNVATNFSRVQVSGAEAIGSAIEESGWCFENTAPVDDTVVQVHLQRDGWIEAIVFSMRPTLTGEATNRFERAET